MEANFNKNYEKLLLAMNLLKEVSEDFKVYNEEALKEITSEQQDLLHIIENGIGTNDEAVKIEIFNHLQIVRNVRRNIKKIIEMNDLISPSLTPFLSNFQQSKNHLTTMKNSFDTPIYRIRNQHIYDTYIKENASNILEVEKPLEDKVLIDLKTKLEQPQEKNLELHSITYVKNEEELVAQIKERNNKAPLTKETLADKDDDFEELLAQQNVVNIKARLEQEDEKILKQQKKTKKNKSKKNKARALKELKKLKIKENKQTVLDLFKQLEKQREQKK